MKIIEKYSHLNGEEYLLVQADCRSRESGNPVSFKLQQIQDPGFQISLPAAKITAGSAVWNDKLKKGG